MLSDDPQKRTGLANHKALRIPHSRFFDIDVVKDPSTDLSHMLPPASIFVDVIRKLKIRREDWLMFYDPYESGILFHSYESGDII